MAKPTENLIGKRFGRLTVISFVGFLPKGTRPQNAAFWECKCDCGNITKTSANQLKQGRTKSCGCLAREVRLIAGKNNALPRGQSAMNCLYGRYKQSAKKRGHAFELSFDEAVKLFKAPCCYCGMPPSQIYRNDYNNGDLAYSGIDRVNNDIGYVKGNCVSCCGKCNTTKGKGSVEELKLWVKMAYEHMFGKRI